MTDYIKSKKNIRRNHQSRGRAVLSLLITCSIIFLGIVYVIQTNSLVGSSYQMRQLKEQLADLQMKNQELEITSAQSQSPANLEKLVANLDLVDAQNIIYLDKDKIVAVNK